MPILECPQPRHKRHREIMAHSQLPLETKWEYLLNLPPKPLLSACRASKENDETCKEQNFWARYFSGMSSKRTNEVLAIISNNSQGYIIAANDGAFRQNPTKVSETTTLILLFNSVMRDDKKAIEYFGNKQLELNAEQIRKIVAKVINVINNEQYDDEDSLENLFKQYYKYLSFFGKDIAYVEITSILLKRIRLGAISNIYIPSETSRYYDSFFIKIISSLAQEGHVAILVSIMMRRQYLPNSNINNYIIAEYLSPDLFDYVNNKLGIDLVNFISNPKDKKKLEYWLSNSSKEKLRIIMKTYHSAGFYFSPETYAEAIYNTDVSQRRKDRNIQQTADYARNKNFIEWANKLESIWIELNYQSSEEEENEEEENDNAQ